MTTKADAKKIERLERLLAAERECAQRAWDGYRATLYENVEIKMKLEAVERALQGKTE